MSNVYKFPSKNTNAHRMFCDNCLCILEYWLGDDDSAYGMCPRCNLAPLTWCKSNLEKMNERT